MDPKEVFSELKVLLQVHTELRFIELVSPKQKPSRLLGVNGIHLLLKLLERSFDLLADSIDAYDRSRTLLLYLAVRAHFETTANLGYFLKNLRRFYQKEIDDKEMDEVLTKLSAGGLVKPTWHGEIPVPDPIRIMSAIDAVDDILRKSGNKENIFRSSYDFISEFCHPNFFGAAYKFKVNLDKGSVVLLSDAESFDKYSKSAGLKLLVSGTAFIKFYKDAFSLLEKNETMPILIK